MNPEFSIVTTCMGRLHNLKRTLPEFLKQGHTEVIVVDYDCPDDTSEYVARVHPQAKVIELRGKLLKQLDIPHGPVPPLEPFPYHLQKSTHTKPGCTGVSFS